MWRCLLVVCVGCPSPDPLGPVCPDEVTLGDGAFPFRAREEGEDAVIVHGPQGGYHIEMSVRASGTTPPWTVVLGMTDAESGVVVSDQNYHLMPDPVDDCVAELPHLLAILDVHELGDGTPAEVLDGREVVLGVVVTDDAAEVQEAELTVTAIGIAD